MKLCRY